MLYSHSYEERCPADAATSFAVPLTGPGFAAKTRGERTTAFFTATPALAMIDAPFSTFASAVVWIVPFSCWGSCCL